MSVVEKDIVCLYHKDCTDGFGSAHVLMTYMRLMGDLERVEFIPSNYGDAPPGVTGKTVYILDFSYKRDVLLAMKEQAKDIVVIDHHKSAQLELVGLDFCKFDMDHCGTVLTWKYFFGDTSEMPLLYKYIEDRDLWLWELIDSKEVSAALQSHEKTFELWDRLTDPEELQSLIEDGRAILRSQKEQMNFILSKTLTTAEIGGHTVPCINSPILMSELGNHIVNEDKPPFAAIYYTRSDGLNVFSLRSCDEGVDVSEIAGQYPGGGGHRNAAGFTDYENKVIV